MAHEATIQGVGISVGSSGMSAPVVLLDARDEILPIFVDHEEAQEIQRAREGMPVDRPLTHDLFAGVLDDLAVTLDRVRIDDLDDGVFYAKLDLAVDRTDDQDVIVCDARPSDGIALAVRLDAPITVAANVLNAAGQPTDAFQIKAPAQQFNDLTGGTRVESDVSEEDPNDSFDLESGVEIDIMDSEEVDEDDDGSTSEHPE